MTAYQLLPGLSPEEYDALRSDIAAHGIRVPVDVDENGQVLDGHHRSLIAAELGIECPRRVLADLTEPEKIAHAIAVNVHRRSLSREQRRELLAASIRAEPEASDREHARRVGTHHETAGAVRAALVDAGDVAETATRRDALGRRQPASKPPLPEGISKHTDKTETYFRNDTGEVVDPGSVPFDQHPDYHPPAPNPLADARAEVAKQPVMLTGKAVDKLKTARKTFQEAGSPADVIADLVNTADDLDPTRYWLDEIESAMSVLNGLAVALRRRNLRSVSR